MIDIMMKVAVLAVAGVMCAMVIKRGTPELGLVLLLAVGAAIMMLVIQVLDEIVSAMQGLMQFAQINSDIIAPVSKTVAISMLTKLSGDICRSAGETAVASFVELAGVILALAVSLPLIEGVIRMMTEILV